MVRQFKLINEKGQEYSLMDLEKYCLLTDPTGLGYSYETEYMQVGSNFIENLRSIQQGNISGNIVCKNYDNLTQFINFVEQAEKLKLSYTVPYQNKTPITYYKDIMLSSLEKTEIDRENNVIIAPVTFDCISLWYEQNETVYDMTKSTREMRWDFRWDSKFKSYNRRSIVFENKGHVEAPIKVELIGYLINPVIAVYVDNKEYASLSFNMTLEEYEKILYCTKDSDIYLYKENQDGSRVNLIEELDLNNNNFFKLPKGVSEIRISGDSEVMRAKLTVFVEYKAV